MKWRATMARERPSLISTFVVSSIAFAVVLLLVYLYESLVPIKTSHFDVPVKTTKTAYRIGEVVAGTFNGEVYTTIRPVIGRKLVCDNQTQALSDFESRVGVPGKIENRTSNIIQLDDRALRVGGTLVPDTDCVIQFTAIYSFPRIVGEPRVEQVSYYTTPFDILPSDGSSSPLSAYNPQDVQSAVSASGAAPAASDAPTTSSMPMTPANTPTGQPSVLGTVLKLLTGL